MPELPEVETVCRTLEHLLKGAEIVKVETPYAKTIATDHSVFEQTLVGKKFTGFSRIGKYLLLELEDQMLISHLRMEGKYYVQQPSDPYDRKHVHVQFYLRDGRVVRYHDTRKFGRMYLYPKQSDPYTYPCMANVGYDAFDERVTTEYLWKAFHSRSITLKQALLDQSVVAGVGNIYADEICFALGYDPRSKVSHLRKYDFASWIKEMRRISQGAINSGGTTIRSYTSSLGVDGRFQLQLKVHMKKGDRCVRCDGIIEKTSVGGRGTYYCKKCQKRR